jgi:diaminohydroxyphosphoribosylaminopyrimidine deaminase/5-amino-6-(5-phosphoribosylamino)uracil reductase
VFDHQARLPLGSQLVRSAARHPTAVITPDPPPPQAAALQREGVKIVAAADLHGALRALRQMDIRSLLVEGGAALATALLAGAVVDRLIIFHGGTVLGRGAVHPWSALPVDSVDAAPRFHILSHRRMGDDLMTTYAPGDAECSPA